MRPSGNITRLPSTGARHVASLEHAVRDHLERLLHSSQFDASARSRDFLCFVVDEVLAGRGADLNQAAIAVTVFGRDSDFDPILDPIVRVQAGRLRRSLERYYLLRGRDELVRIELPKGRYAPVFVTGPAADEHVAIRSVTLARAVPDWPTVVIHPFALSSSDDAELGSRMKDVLTMELCRYGDVRVVRQPDLDELDPRQQSAVRFELRGTLRRNADECLAGARLVDRVTGEEIWSEEYHTLTKTGRWSSNIEDVPRLVAARIGSEQGVIARALVGEAAASPESAGDFGAIRRAYHFFLSRQISTLLPAIEALEQLTAREPELAPAWTWLARLCIANHSFELSDVPTTMEKAIECAHQALLLDPTSARVRCVLATALLVKGETQAARDELEQALRLNSESLVYREVIGWLRALTGDWEQGVRLMREAMERNPYCLPLVRHGLWAEHLRRGDYGEAYVDALEYRDPCFFWRELMTACSLGHLDRKDEARASAALLLQARPDFAARGRALIGHYIKLPELSERVAAGLEQAGLRLD